MRALESLDLWTVARDVAVQAYQLTMESPLNRHFALADQIRRAAISAPANIAEGYALGTTPQLIRHLRIALGSTAELKTHVDVAERLGLIKSESARRAVGGCDRTTSLLVGFLRKLGARVC